LAARAARVCLEEALTAGDVAAVKVTGSAPDQERLLDGVLAIAQSAGIAVLTEDDVDLALKRMTDGVEIGADVSRLAAARSMLGESAIVAARCGTSRHEAMEMAEAGADYVALEAGSGGGESLVAWWAELFEVPCVAVLAPGEARQAIADGADFLVPPANMWASPEKARSEVAELTAMITEAGA
jgi:thiamine-phosphate pyrophosphorylase